MAIAQDEIFGSVMSVLKYKDWDELIARANHPLLGHSTLLWGVEAVVSGWRRFRSFSGGDEIAVQRGYQLCEADNQRPVRIYDARRGELGVVRPTRHTREWSLQR